MGRTMTPSEQHRQNTVAQWAFDTSPILGRFHLWLEDVEVEATDESLASGAALSFMPERIESMMAMTAAVTALGTKLYGRFGEGKDLDSVALDHVKKDADAVSAYAMSEALWCATRQLPENHAVLVCLGEGLMPKLGETPEMGSNPQLGFGRVYARPQVARWVDERVARLLNDESYCWKAFYDETKRDGIKIWGAAIDTLENTSRFAKGDETGPLTVLHVFDQPLRITRPYEGYVGNLLLPKEIVDKAAERSLYLDYRTPREEVVEAIEETYPGILRENIHVWTLGGSRREKRLGTLWEQWRSAGTHLVESGWKLPTGMEAFTDSGSYAPTYSVGTWKDGSGAPHVFLCDGYAGSAEAMQAASLAPVLGLDASLCLFTSKFALSWEQERDIMQLDPESESFQRELERVAGQPMDESRGREYRDAVRSARDAGMPLGRPVVRAHDFFPEKDFQVLAACGYMCPDPYTGAESVRRVGNQMFRTTVRLAGEHGQKVLAFTFRSMEEDHRARLVFHPLLVRFFNGEDHETRPVRISDSGRIRNELQTLCSEALEHDHRTIRVHFDGIRSEVISEAHKLKLLEVLRWYKQEHPVWFAWLEVVAP